MQPILEVAIGMVVAVAALAIVVSSAMELVSALLRLARARWSRGSPACSTASASH